MVGLKAPLAVTMGDPSGIGPELIHKSWLARHQHDIPSFFAIADPDLFDPAETAVLERPEDSLLVFKDKLPVFPLHLNKEARPGQPAPENSNVILEAIRTAHHFASEGKAAALVTAPVNKHILYDVGFTHPGQTEYLAELCHIAVEDTVMMLAAPQLRVIPLTIHIPLKDVASSITHDLILSRARTVLKALQRDFDIATPRLAVCGLNPHAGEDGHIGQEEENIIIPALNVLREQGFNVTGPLSADTLFHEGARQSYDAVLAMYHDQALIPLKTLDFYNGVNTTLGLPVIRTSPDHGTAYNIAGKNCADPRSMIAALKLAESQALNRARYDH